MLVESINIQKDGKISEVEKKMPVFRGSDCPEKIGLWLIASTAVTMILIYISGIAFGLVGETLVLLASLVTTWYLIDYFGDSLFKQKKSKTDIESSKGRQFPYHN